MATPNNSRSDLLNKNSHDHLLSHKTETAFGAFGIIKNMCEEMKHSKNVEIINNAIRSYFKCVA